MARSHARIAVTIWQDTDFRALRPSPQRLYLFLVSQPNLTHLGVLPLTLRRWADTADAYSLDDLSDDLAELEEAGFVVVDEAAEELLVRSYLRNDGVYKQPNVLKAAVGTVAAIHSVRVKRTLLAEVDRIDLAELTDDGGEKSQRRTVERHLEEIRAGIGDLPPEPPWNPSPNPSGKGSGNPSGNPNGNPSQGTHAGRVPVTLPGTHAGTPYARAGAQPLAPSPYPLAPTPSPKNTCSNPRSSFDAFWTAYPRKVGKQAARKAYTRARKHVSDDQLLAAVSAFRDDPNLPADKSFIPHPATWLNEGRWNDEPLPPRLQAVVGGLPVGTSPHDEWGFD